MNNTTSTTIPLEKLGHPGIGGELTVLYVLKDEKRPDSERLNDKSEREFIIKACLSRHAQANEEIKAGLDENSGGSCFLAHPDAVVTKLYSPEGPFDIFHNKKRELSLVNFSCKAISATAARQKFIDAVMPFFDYICFKADLPLHMPLVICEDQKNQSYTFDYVTPFPKATINPHEATFVNELIPIYAIYREAKNAQSPFYKYLCYFKIIEGIYKKVRPEAAKKARQRGLNITMRRELVPAHAEIDQSLVNTPIGPIFSDRFEKQYRDRVAHYILNSGEILNVSDYITTRDFARELLLIEICTRVVLEAQEEYCNAANK